MLQRTRWLAAGSGALTALLFFSGLASSQNLARGPAGAAVDSVNRLRQLFADPPAEYRTFPFMVWNGEVTEKEIDLHLADFKAKGTGGVFIHPRPGLITEYLSDRWFELIRYTVDQGKKQGSQVWLYDENSYPSGFAGGHVPAEMPESWNQGQGLVPEKLSRLDAAAAAKYKLILKSEGGRFRDVTAAAARGEESSGDYWGFTLASYPKRAWHGGWSYVDLIKPGVTEKFIELTMRGYERSIGVEFGKTVPGIFTDEPNINPPVRRALRWTPDLFDAFHKRWGYDLRPLLPSLYEETGEWRKTRHDYYGLLLELFIDRWAKPWRRYTDEHSLAWTGHYWEHAWPNPSQGPDNMAMYAWHHVPAIDMLFNQFAEGVNAQFGNVRSVKELASVANQMGYRRRLSETYGGAGWEVRFEDLKRLGDWQAVLGVNLINQHLAYETLAGSRKYDYPQSFSYHNPWWQHYRTQGDYFGRVSLAMAAGDQVNRVLVIEPTTSAWMYASPGEANARMMQIGTEFQEFITQLESRQGEFDLGSENVMQSHGRVDGRRLVVGQRAYDVVVLPPGLENLDAATARLLTAYANHGGAVVAFVPPPARIDGASDDRMAKLAEQRSAAWLRAQSLDDAVARERLLAGGFHDQQGKVYHQRRHLRDGELLFFVNSSLEQPAAISLRTAGRSVTALDAFTGAAKAYPAQVAGDSVDFSVALAQGGSALLLVSRQRGPAVAPPAAPVDSPVAAPRPLTVRRTSPNMLRVDYCDLRIGDGAAQPDLYFFAAQDKVFRHFGFDGNPWNTAVQYKRSILDRDEFPAGSGFEATFRFDADGGFDLAGVRAVVERPALWQVSVNGQAVESRPGEWWLDRAFGVYDVGRYLKAGANQIGLRAARMSVHHEIEPVILLGEFGLAAQARGFRLVAPAPLVLGDWKSQGLPQYSHEVAYSRAVDLQGGGHYVVRLGKWAGTVAEVRLNGKSAGVIGNQPYERNISALVRGGSNDIEVRVCGSLKNLLGPHHGKINRGLTAPGSFRNGPPAMPAGSAYDLESYGLMEDFQVVAQR